MNTTPPKPAGSRFDQVASKLDELLNQTPEESQQKFQQAPAKIFFLILGLLLLVGLGFFVYAWGDTNLHVRYKGIAVLAPKWCSTYDKSLWFWPSAKQLPRPDRWQLYAARVRGDQVKMLSVGTGSCRFDQPEACCNLLHIPLAPILPEKYWNSASWDIPKQYQ